MLAADTTDPGQEFLDKYKERNFQLPETKLNEARYSRWPERWDEITAGVPDMSVAGKDRRDNYM